MSTSNAPSGSPGAAPPIIVTGSVRTLLRPCSQRFEGLDFLRAVAIGLVLGRHALFQFDLLPGFVRQFLEVWREGGWIGVDLFFVLSGFLVSGLLLDELRDRRVVNVKRFLLRRSLKIYPSFFLFLFVSTLAILLFRPTAFSTSGVLGEVLFLQNYVGSLWNHTWSLAVEEHFYFLLAFTFVFFARQWAELSSAKLFWLFVGVAILCGVARWAADRRGVFPYLTHQRIDSLMFGVVIAHSYRYHRERFVDFFISKRVIILMLSVALLLPPFFVPIGSSKWSSALIMPCLYLGAGGLVGLAVALSSLDLSFPRFLIWIGRHSYSIYLWHMPLAWIMSTWATKQLKGSAAPWIGFPLYFIGSVAAGILMSYLVEIPVLRVRDRLWPSATVSRSGATEGRVSI